MTRRVRELEAGNFYERCVSMFSVSKFSLALGLALAIAAQAEPAQKIHVPTLNALVGKMVKEVLVESQQGPNPLFSALELKLDEKGTDLNSEDRVQLKLDASAAVHRTRWNTPASISLSVSG